MTGQPSLALVLQLASVADCSCGVPIAWAMGEHAGAIPFEPELDDAGDLALELVDGELVARVVASGPAVHEAQLGLQLDVDVVELGPRVRSHWGRCPHADEHRRGAA